MASYFRSPAFHKILPRKRLTSIVGNLASSTKPRWLVDYIIRRFISTNGIDMTKYQVPSEGFLSFNDFFARHLKQLPNFQGRISAGAEGTMAGIGAVRANDKLLIKGVKTSLEELLNVASAKDIKNYYTIYLAPDNYHRVHMPVDFEVTKISYITGDFWSVSDETVEKIDDLYLKNERVVIHGKYADKSAYLVLVGALIVGKIVLTFLSTASNKTLLKQGDLEHSQHLRQGDEVGYFEMGSTIVFLSEAEWLGQPKIQDGQRIGLGQAVI